MVAGVGVRIAVEAQRQLGCVLVRQPWRMALLDMAEGEEAGSAGDGEQEDAGGDEMEADGGGDTDER